jgi:gas vesicle protein
MSKKSFIGIGAGLVAIAAASYYFFGPDGKDRRTKMKGWMIRMKGEVIEKIEDAKELTEPIYRDIIDSVVAASIATARASKEEVMEFADRLKSQWNDIVAEMEDAKDEDKDEIKKRAKRVIRKATKKVK